MASYANLFPLKLAPFKAKNILLEGMFLESVVMVVHFLKMEYKLSMFMSGEKRKPHFFK
jgi:hypothetical protein